MKQLWHMIERYYPWLLLLLGVDCFCAVILWISDIQVFQTLIGLVVLTSILLFSAILFVLNKRENTHMELFRDFLSDPTICNEERLLSAISQKEGESVRFLASVLREYKNESNNMADALRDYEEYVEGWAHEAKTPLSLLTMLLDNRNDEISPSLQAKLDYVRSQLQEDVTQMLYYARLKSSTKDYRFEDVNLNDCLGEVYEGYIPATPEKHREVWHEKVKIKLTDVFGLTDSEAQNVIEKLESMNLKEAYAYLEQEYDWYGARYLYEDSTYYKGTAEEINAYLDKKLEDKTFSFYYARKFADFAGLYMVFFAIIMLAVLFLQDTKKHTYELLHTKPVTAGKYVMGKVSAGFTICLLVLTILNILFWVLCRIYTKDSGFEVRLWDFVASTVLYILPNMLMIVSIYTLISLIFKNPLPGVPLLILYMVYSNLGGTNAEGVYGYWGKPLAIMVRFPGQLFDTTPPPMALLNQSFLIIVSVVIILISIQIWKRRRI